MKRFEKTFRTAKPVIGALHLLPLLGYTNSFSLDDVIKKASEDLYAFEKGGVDSVIIENNYDIPHTPFVGPETVASMTAVMGILQKQTKLPLGISVLWNDYKAALAIAVVSNASFIRVPVFVDSVRTMYGDIFAESEKVIHLRKKMNAEHVLLLTDIHVKHATLLSAYTLQESAKESVKAGSDGLIITGKWTADAPDIKDLQDVRKSVGKFPILIGSGATCDTIQLFQVTDGVIVGTALKTSREKRDKINIKGYNESIDENKVKEFVTVFRKIHYA